jgi:hypothetical protein
MRSQPSSSVSGRRPGPTECRLQGERVAVQVLDCPGEFGLDLPAQVVGEDLEVACFAADVPTSAVAFTCLLRVSDLDGRSTR